MAAAELNQALPAGIGDYRSPDDAYDEAVAGPGAVRAAYSGVMAALERHDLRSLARRVQARAEAVGANLGRGRAFAVDPVPRVLAAAEWTALEAGLMQRAAALNSFLADTYGDQRIFEAGAIPRRLLETSGGFEPRMRGLLDPAIPAATVAGLDLVRNADGAFEVLEDNLRMPSGSAYAAAAREAVADELGAALEPLPLGVFAEVLGESIRAAAPDGRGDPSAAILSDGPAGATFFEHASLATELEIPLVNLGQIEPDRGGVCARIDGRKRHLDVIYRRIDGDRLSAPGGARLTPIGELLLPALESGALGCINAFGTAVADDKLTHAYVGEMIRFYLGEAPIIASVPTIDLSDEELRSRALAHPEGLVLKPREEFGGSGVVILDRAADDEREAALGRVRRDPAGHVAQETVSISTHPTVCGAELRPRHVDLRPFVVSGPGGASVMPGGLTRFAREAGEMVVSSSMGGGGKDTWVLDLPSGDGAR